MSLRGTSEEKAKEEEEDDGGFLQCEALCQSSQSVAEASFKRWWFRNSDHVTKTVTACCRDAFIAQNGDIQCLEQHIQCYFRCLLDSKCNEFCGSLGRNLNINERTTLKDAVKNEIADFCQLLKPKIIHQEGGSFWKNDALARVQRLQIINQIKLDLRLSGMMLAGLMKLLNENVSSMLEKLIARCMDEYLQYMDSNERMSKLLRREPQVKSLIAFRSRNIKKMSEESMVRIKKQIKDING